MKTRRHCQFVAFLHILLFGVLKTNYADEKIMMEQTFPWNPNFVILKDKAKKAKFLVKKFHKATSVDF